MSTDFLVQLPDHLEKAYRLGKIVVTGGVARYASTGQIVAHLEPVMPVVANGMSAAMNPQFAMAHSAFEMAKITKGMVVDTAKLNKIIRLSQSIEKLSTVNLAVSGVTLGVAVAGFAIVLHKLNDIDKHLKLIDNRLQSIEAKLDAITKNEVYKLIQAVQLDFKQGITLVRQLVDLGWNEHLDTEVAKHLDKLENQLNNVINRCIDGSKINVSSELAQYL